MLACDSLVDAHALDAVSRLDPVLSEEEGRGREGEREGGGVRDQQERKSEYELSSLSPPTPPHTSLPPSLPTTKSYSKTRLTLLGICPRGARSGISWIVTLW